ncbi:probable disease resistance protein At4g19060 [Humulus lupulus]|uniref:probable disease resistance protein At4g19060 n=1 Tax=Humulus lupulus TaxID=3486 RepID=UPI002B40E8B6|nr:probable disease resistance protein At4g19060 [Humulus lupulus]
MFKIPKTFPRFGRKGGSTSKPITRGEQGKTQNEKPPHDEKAESTQKYDVEILWTSTKSTHNLKVYGLENEILALEKIFERHENENENEDDNQLKVVGIVGTRGVGKTKLCEEYFNLLGKPEKNGEKVFVPRIWVSTSIIRNDKDRKKRTVKEEEMNLSVIVEEMLESLGVDTDDIVPNDSSRYDHLEVLLYLLHLQLIGKRYLIVLDDLTLFPVDDACKLATNLPKGYKGTIMVTSREEEIVKRMARDERDVHRFLPLSDPQSLWLIFKDAVEQGVKDEGIPDHDFDWEKETEEELRRKCYDEIVLGGKKIYVEKLIEKTVISKCNGIPLAAKLMAKTMSKNIKKFIDENEKNKQLPRKVSQMDNNSKDDDNPKTEEQHETINNSSKDDDTHDESMKRP